ncbi:MAG TPA: hypothetical protein VNI77_12035 [Nitrososphaera sp.]|nr:hypothetical protein [Nitrososphaera sp.]
MSRKILQLAELDEMARPLITMLGIGYYSAFLIVNEIGDINSSLICATFAPMLG